MADAIILEPIAMSVITPSATATGYNGDNMANDQMGLVWNSGAGSSTRDIIIDLGADTAIDTIVLVGLRGATSSWDWSIDLATEAQGAFTGGFFAGTSRDLLAGANMPVSGLGKALWQASSETSPPASVRYVRINFTNLSSAAVEVSRIIIASAFQPAINFSFGAVFGFRSMGRLEFSKAGVPLRRQAAKLRAVGLRFTGATQAEVDDSIHPMFERLGNDTPLCIVTDPAADANLQNRIYFGYLTGDLGTVWAVKGGFQAQFNVVALD